MENTWYWTGWKRHHWPADVVRPGLKLYGANLESRQIITLLQVTRGGSFVYGDKSAFREAVKRLTGSPPDDSPPHWKRIAAKGTGLALRSRVIKPVSIPLQGRFPQIGWLNLGSTKQLDLLRRDPADLYEEGRRHLRKHMQIERNAKLRSRSKSYWRGKLGGLYCVACEFDFGKLYGDHGGDFIEMHHKDPLGTRKHPLLIGVEDLIPLCSNCHRMVHRYPENPLSLKQLKRLIVSR